jgi:hypothetical protein
MKKIALIAAAGALALGLAACHSKPEETSVDTNVTNLEGTPVDNAEIVNVIEEPAPEANVTKPVATSKDFTDSAQTQDDAEATGMTSRASRDDDNSAEPTH